MAKIETLIKAIEDKHKSVKISNVKWNKKEGVYHVFFSSEMRLSEKDAEPLITQYKLRKHGNV